MCRGGLIAKRLIQSFGLGMRCGKAWGKTKRPLHIGNRQCVPTRLLGYVGGYHPKLGHLRGGFGCGFGCGKGVWPIRFCNQRGQNLCKRFRLRGIKRQSCTESVRPIAAKANKSFAQEKQLGGVLRVELRCLLGKRKGAGVGRRTAIFRKRLFAPDAAGDRPWPAAKCHATRQGTWQA